LGSVSRRSGSVSRYRSVRVEPISRLSATSGDLLGAVTGDDCHGRIRRRVRRQETPRGDPRLWRPETRDRSIRTPRPGCRPSRPRLAVIDLYQTIRTCHT
jgi:hypothetical protein